jgi:ankyrin repeat protein
MKELFEAIKSGDRAKIAELLDHNAALANADENGQKAIFTAMYFGKPEIAKLLESRGAELDVFAAAMMGRVDKLEELLAANRSLASQVSHDGWTPLHLASFFDAEPAVRLLLNKGAPVGARSTNALRNMPIHAAASRRNAACVKLLIEHGAQVNAQQHGGWAALHAAAQNGDLATAALLVEAGADVNMRAENNQRPLDLAMTKGHQDMVEYLESKGASL